jgi:hypothetical protein
MLGPDCTASSASAAEASLMALAERIFSMRGIKFCANYFESGCWALKAGFFLERGWMGQTPYRLTNSLTVFSVGSCEVSFSNCGPIHAGLTYH